jgi:uncharacterized PurR-regulated membrane protein YhhQ (DUF165 family)
LIYGIIYIALVYLLSVTLFPFGALSTNLIFPPLWGLTLILRDLTQYTYEDTPEKKLNHTGFWPSMMFVGAGATVCFFYSDPSLKYPVMAGCIFSNAVDGWAFSQQKQRSLGFRLLYSNILGSVVDVGVFASLTHWMGSYSYSMQEGIFITFMEIFPALLFFLISIHFNKKPHESSIPLFHQWAEHIEKKIQEQVHDGWIHQIAFDQSLHGMVVMEHSGQVRQFNQAAVHLLATPIRAGEVLECLHALSHSWLEASLHLKNFPLFFRHQEVPLEGRVIVLPPALGNAWLILFHSKDTVSPSLF